MSALGWTKIVSMRAVARVVLLAAVLVLAWAGPASADPAGPSDFRSEVTGIVPDQDGVHAEIRGGDAFLELTVEPGTTVVVEGYVGEPYVRIDADGTVERNRRSPATYINEDRRGIVDIPAEANADAEPDWEVVGDGGTYAWHDHRVHWMADAPPDVDRGESVGGAYDPWIVPIVVDGAPAGIHGSLVYAESTSVLPWIGLALLAAAGLFALGRRHPVRVAAVGLTASAALALVVGRADWASTPGGGNPLLWLLPVVALVAAGAALALARRPVGVVLVLASVAVLSGWALLRFQVLLKPVLPTELPAALDRASVALALGVSVAATALALTSGSLRLPDLDGEPDSTPA